GATYLGCGFFAPNPADLNRIRQDIDLNYDQWNKILSSKNIANTFGKLTGNKLSTSPRGFDIHHPAIDLLRYKQFILRKNFTD
ncbi:DUF2461 family protein, partial [Klebsiella pneumoniae]|uniref:DUF2461 family protein n=1 Tax=Klebsiella pneumoniae TaxID=573 RepID=UPI003EE018F9